MDRARRGRGGVVAALGAIVVAAGLAVVGAARAVAGDITTVAGGRGEGAATNIAQSPDAVAVKGPLVYTADRSTLVRVLDLRTGISRVVAGDGRLGFRGDGGPARVASLDRPGALGLTGVNGVGPEPTTPSPPAPTARSGLGGGTTSASWAPGRPPTVGCPSGCLV
jgi:hypothetical protein